MTGLSKEQKRLIAQLARQAYLAWPERAAFEAINSDLSLTACFAAWRHVEQGKATATGSGQACGIQSLRECTQAHYRPLKAHFENLLGQTDRASRTLAGEAGNSRRIAAHKLDQALRERDLAEGYAAAICRRQFRCALAEASEKQLWNLVFTIRNRRPSVTATARKSQLAAAPDGNPF